jgi:DNA polymerase phi
LKALVAPPHGSHSFDSRTIEKIVAKLDLKGVRGWIKYLKSFILGEANEDEEDDAEIAADGTIAVKEAEDEKSVTAKRIWAFDQLLHIVKANTVQKDDEVLAGLLEFFAVLGWFQIRKSGKGAVRIFLIVS